MPPADLLSIHRRPATAGSGVALFPIVRNEADFLPHFLRRSRGLGMREFWSLDDRSTDGTRESLLAQADCGIVAASLGYGDPCGDLRSGVAARTLVPREFEDWPLVGPRSRRFRTVADLDAAGRLHSRLASPGG